MNPIYLFNDWTSASRMRNSSDTNCHLKVKVSVILSDGKDKEIEGYHLTVYHEITKVEVYKFFVDYGRDDRWSLTSEEAIEVLNKIGFNCKYERPHYDLSDKMRSTLKSLIVLGYTHIWRTKDLKVMVSGDQRDSLPVEFSSIADKVNYKYNYYNFIYLDTTPSKIEGYLNQGDS